MSRPGFNLWGEVGSVFQLLRQGIDFPPVFERSLESELNELLAPHMPVLAYKRGKFGGSDRWTQDLDDFVDGIIRPHLSAVNAKVRRLAEIVDRLVASAARDMNGRSEVIPLTSRFDSSWAL